MLCLQAAKSKFPNRPEKKGKADHPNTIYAGIGITNRFHVAAIDPILTLASGQLRAIFHHEGLEEHEAKKPETHSPRKIDVF